MDDKARRGNEIERKEDNPEGETTRNLCSIGYARVSWSGNQSIRKQADLMEELASRKGFESVEMFDPSDEV